MIRISKKGDYGLILLTALAKSPKEKYIPLQLLAEENNLPYKFISQIALTLKSAGIITSKEGLGGGYKLAQDPSKISLSDTLQALEGPISPVACLQGKKCRCSETCQHQKVMSTLAKSLETTLNQYSLADLAK